MKSRYFLSVLFILSTYILSFASSLQSENYQDSLPLLNPDYQGYRLAITNFEVDQIEDWINIRFTAINTGREDLVLGKNISNPPLVLNIDRQPSNSIFEEYKNTFTETLLNSELNIRAGEVLYDREIKIKTENSRTELPDTIETNILPAEIANVNLNDNSKTSVIPKGFSELINDESNCSDLIIESVSIVKKSKNGVTLKYKIKNQGKQPVSLVGNTKSEEDNLAITIHMSSSEKLTRGSIPIGATFLKDVKHLPDGKLYPGKSFTDELKIDIRNMTRFTPIIILQIDPYLSVQECNETNNLNHIKVK